MLDGGLGTELGRTRRATACRWTPLWGAWALRAAPRRGQACTAATSTPAAT